MLAPGDAVHSVSLSIVHSASCKQKVSPRVFPSLYRESGVQTCICINPVRLKSSVVGHHFSCLTKYRGGQSATSLGCHKLGLPRAGMSVPMRPEHLSMPCLVYGVCIAGVRLGVQDLPHVHWRYFCGVFRTLDQDASWPAF